MRDRETSEFLAEETKLANEVATKLIEKPKMSIMVVIFPFLLINYIQELRIYRHKRDFFLKEYLFLKRMVCEKLREERYSDAELKKTIEKILLKNPKYIDVYRCQIEEALAIKKYLARECDILLVRSKEIETIKKTIEVLKLEGDNLETSQKLLEILANSDVK